MSREVTKIRGFSEPPYLYLPALALFTSGCPDSNRDYTLLFCSNPSDSFFTISFVISNCFSRFAFQVSCILTIPSEKAFEESSIVVKRALHALKASVPSLMPEASIIIFCRFFVPSVHFSKTSFCDFDQLSRKSFCGFTQASKASVPFSGKGRFFVASIHFSKNPFWVLSHPSTNSPCDFVQELKKSEPFSMILLPCVCL